MQRWGAERQKPLPQRSLGNFTKCTFPASPSPFHSEPLGERARNVDVCTVPASQEGVGTLSQSGPQGSSREAPQNCGRLPWGVLGHSCERKCCLSVDTACNGNSALNIHKACSPSSQEISWGEVIKKEFKSGRLSGGQFQEVNISFAII